MAGTPSATETAITDNAAGPKSASVDGQSVSQHSIREQIEADRYLASKASGRGRGIGVRRNKISLPGGQS